MCGHCARHAAKSERIEATTKNDLVNCDFGIRFEGCHLGQRRKIQECDEVKPSGCGVPASPTPSSEVLLLRFEAVDRVLSGQNAEAGPEARKQFVEMLERSIRQRNVVSQLGSKIASGDSDIISLIQRAIDSRNTDEAIWQCFLATHFGRPSARDERQAQSASRFLCAFRQAPFWTWDRVTESPDALREWLFECPDELATLMYGNHRKYESPKPKHIWSVCESFIWLGINHHSLEELISANAERCADGFDALYRRLRAIKRFGRTGRFDFLILLLDLGIISSEPTKPYLQDSTGPLAGAKLLWGEHSPKQLDAWAAELTAELGVSSIAMEDALCNWQK